MAETGNCTIADVSNLWHKYCCWKQEALLLRVLNDLLISKHESGDSLVLCYQLFCQVLIVNVLFFFWLSSVKCSIIWNRIFWKNSCIIVHCTATSNSLWKKGGIKSAASLISQFPKPWTSWESWEYIFPRLVWHAWKKMTLINLQGTRFKKAGLNYAAPSLY